MQAEADDINDRRLRELVRQLNEKAQADQVAIQRETLAAADRDRTTDNERQARVLNLAELKRTDDLNREATDRNIGLDAANVMNMPGMDNAAKANELQQSVLRNPNASSAPGMMKVIEGLTRVPEKAKPVQYTYTDPKTGAKSLRFADPTAIAAGGLDMGNEPPSRGPAAEYEWVTRGGNPMQIRKGSAQPGDRPYEKPSASANGPDPAKAAETQSKILAAAKALRDAPGRESLTGNRVGNADYGYGLASDPISGTGAANAKPLYDTLKSLMTLENLGLLKGAMSDKDVAFIQSAGSSLDTKMDDPTFLAELNKIIGKFENVQGVNTDKTAPPLTDLIYDPKTKTFHPRGGQ
jgi:hypothetical protein